MKVYVGPTRSRDTVPLIASRGTWEAIVAALPPDDKVLRRRDTPREAIVNALQATAVPMITITFARSAAEDVIQRAAALPRKDVP